MVGEALGRFRVIEKIGSGGMGEVYRAHDDQLERDVALKVLPAGTLADEAARKLFRNEALMLAKLNHPSIATIHEFGSHEGLDFLVMELIPGRSFKEILRDGPLTENEVRRLGLQLAEGLAAAHQQGIIHRDLKPANIMITSDGRLKILDFGFAKLMEGTIQDVAQSSSHSENIPGTLPYMAPEQFRGGPVDMRTDVYATGAVLYEAATGQRPFPATNVGHLIQSILNESPRTPGEVNPRLSASLQTILLRALEKNPERRYHSIQELGADLDRLEVKQSKAATATTVMLDLSQSPPVEMAHVLFIDVVQFSMMPMDEQRVGLRELQAMVRSTTEFARANSLNQLIPLPTGDGMALVFFGDSESPLRCAVELSRALRAKPGMNLRMGIHTGPVYRVPDINAARNVAGGGINLAQRVMDCGDAGHILLSKAIADVLMQLSHWWSSLHDLGEVTVKHGVRIHLFNFYTDDVGDPKPPSKLKTAKASHKQSAGSAKRQAVAHPTAGSVQREKREPQIREAAQISQSSARTHTVQITVPSMSRRSWLALTACILALVATIVFVIARVSRPIVPPSVPRDGKYLAVFPFSSRGEVKPMAEILNNELSKRLLALPGMSGIVSSAATEALTVSGLIDTRLNSQEIATKLSMNRVLRGTVDGTPQKCRITVVAENIAAGTQYREEFSGGENNLNALADQIYTWAVHTLDLAAAMPAQSEPPSEELAKFDFYLKSYTVAPVEQRCANARNALEFYEEAVNRDSHSALAWAGLARAKLAMFKAKGEPSWSQDSQVAAQHSENLGTQSGLPAQAHAALGEVYRDTGRSDAAYKHFRRALMLSPNDDLWKQLARTYEMDGKDAQAILALENAVTMNPQNERNYNALGNVYFELGRYDLALLAYRHAIEINPDYMNAQMNLGNASFEQAKYDEAIVEYEKTLRLGTDAKIYENLGVAYLFLKRYGDAVRMLERAAKMKPDDEEVAGNLGDAYRASGSKQKSMQSYSRAITLAKKQLEANPKDSQVLGDIAVYYAKVGDEALADHYIRQARAIDSASPRLLYSEAIIRAMAKHSEAALESLRAALEKGFSVERAKLDPDLEALRADSGFTGVLANLGTKK